MVIGIIAVLLVLVVPAFTSRKTADDVTKASWDVIGALENARTYAIGNSTYVWVGFFEEDIDDTSRTRRRPSGVGRVVISVAASREGNRYKDTDVSATDPHAFYTPSATPTPIPGNDSNPVLLAQVGKLIKIDNCHLDVLPLSGLPRPAVPLEYQVAADEFATHPPTLGAVAVANPTTFNYPLNAGAADINYTFVKAIEFNPRGEALKIVDLPTQLIEIGLRPTHGNVADAASLNTVAIQVSFATGKARVYRR